MNEPSVFLANSGPCLREQLQTSPVGAVSLVRPLPLVTAGLAALGGRLDERRGTYDARLATLFRDAVPVLADTLGLRLDLRPRSQTRTLAVRLWVALRAEDRLPTLAGVIRQHTQEEIERGGAGAPAFHVMGAPNWAPADPGAADSAEDIALATAVALLLPAVAVPPLLLWRREPEPSRSPYGVVWTIREVSPAPSRDTCDGIEP